MKKSLLTITILIAGLFVSSQIITGCGGKTAQSEGHEHAAGDTTSHDEMKMDSTAMAYACPMHPDVTGKEGDKCSKCGMKLEAVASADTTKHEH